MGWPDCIWLCFCVISLILWFWSGNSMSLACGIETVINGGGTVQFGNLHLYKKRDKFCILDFSESTLDIPEETYDTVEEAVDRLLMLVRKERD